MMGSRGIVTDGTGGKEHTRGSSRRTAQRVPPIHEVPCSSCFFLFPQLLSISLSKDLVICCLDTTAAVSPPLIHFNWKVIIMQTLFGIICSSALLELRQLASPAN